MHINVGTILHLCSSNIFGFMLMLDDEGFLKALLLANLVPSTPTHYLGSRLEIFIVP
jgi:hypothetical protein